MKWHIWIATFLADISVCVATQEPDMEHVARLTDGTTIELIAIRPYGGGDPRRTREKPGPWWGPDGTLLTICPDKRNWSCSWNDSYLMVVAVDNTDDVSCRVVGPWDSDLMVQPIKDKGQGFENRDIRRFTLRFGNQKSGDIRLCIATGQWKTLEHWSIDKWSTPYDHFFVSSEQVIMRCPEQKGSDVVAEVTQVVTERATRLVAFDRDGGLYQSKEEQGGESAGLVRVIHRFNGLDISSIDHLEFQVRPYDYWVTFRNVSLDCGHKTHVEIDIKKPGCLLGEILPSFDSIVIDKQQEQLKGKALCICFFDMNQRPSRNCILQLSKRAQELKAKDIVVFAVQASKADENAIKAWVRENNISFPVGMIQADEEKTRFAWGVRSLPWLILTDREHIIKAEGFALEELNGKIENLTPSGRPAGDVTRVTGVVKGPEGKTVSGVRVTQYQTSEEYLTDSEGRFVCLLAPSEKNRHFFFAIHKERKLVGVGLLPEGETNLAIELRPGTIVSGRVIDPNGRPVVGATVEALPVGATYVLTDAQGEFDIGWDSKQAGDLFLMVRQVKSNLAGLFDISAKPVQVEFSLAPALTLRGKVTDPDDKPISGARVGIGLRIEAFTTGVAGLHGIFTSIRSTSTDDKGRFQLNALPQKQEWIIYTSAEDNGYVDRRVATGIINTITDREDIGQIILKKPNQFVSGIVVDNAGKPAANCRVGVQGEGQPEDHSGTIADAQGRFTLEKICSGDITIWAKLDNMLYGSIQAQAGQKNVRLVVSPIH